MCRYLRSRIERRRRNWEDVIEFMKKDYSFKAIRRINMIDITNSYLIY